MLSPYPTLDQLPANRVIQKKLPGFISWMSP